MRRRTYLALAGTSVLAGCSGGTDAIETTTTREQGESQPTETETETPPPPETETEEPTPTETSTPEAAEPDVVIGESRLGFDDSGFGTDAYVAAEITNLGDVPSGTVTLRVDWFDSNGDYLTDSIGELGSLGAGEVWRARVYGITVDAEKVDDYDIFGEFGIEPPSVSEGVELVSSELLTGEEVKVRGEVENNSEITVDYIEFRGKIYNSDGQVLGDAWTNETDFAPGSTWRVDPGWRGRERIPLAHSHEVVLKTTAF